MSLWFLVVLFGIIYWAPSSSSASADVNSILSSVGLGTAGLRDSTEEIVRQAIETYGVRLIDTAQAEEWYREDAVGRGILSASKNIALSYNRSIDNENERIKLTVVTKIHPRSFALEKMRSMLLNSMKNLYDVFNSESAGSDLPLIRTELVVLLHSPRCWPGHCSQEEESISWHTGWRNLEILSREYSEQITFIGVSNFHFEELSELVLSVANEKVHVVQNWMDPFNHDWEVRSFAAEHRIQYMAYSSFGTQWLGRKYPEDHNPVFNNPALQSIADKHSTSIAQVVLSWVIACNATAIPRASQPHHLKDNFQFLSNKDSKGNIPVSLDEEDLSLIGELDGLLGNPWD